MVSHIYVIEDKWMIRRKKIREKLAFFLKYLDICLNIELIERIIQSPE
jgi:hypothetical protein